MMAEAVAQRDRRSLVEEDTHSDRGQRTSRSVLQDSAYLLDGDARKPFHELGDGCAVLEILKERSHRYPRPANTQAPLTLPGARSTAGQVDQSITATS